MKPPPRTIADRFEIVHHAGRGGVGDVYLAKDLQTGDDVALKLVRNATEKGIARFRREAQMLAILSHPGIVQYIDHGLTDDGLPYLVMEWIEGESLDKRLKRGKLAQADAMRLTRAIAKALRVAHWRGIVHRDIKPSNLYLVGGDLERVKILDFGIARMVSPEVTPLTESGTALGSPGYMSPEQARGAPSVDSRADVFSIGSVLFHCLTGRAPFVGESAVSLILRVVLDQAPRVRDLAPGVPAAVDALVARMLAKDPDDRPKSAAEVVDELARLEETEGRASAVPPAPALTTTERRMVCAVLAHTHIGASGTLREAGPLGASLPPASRDEAERVLTTVLQQYGATVDHLQSGVYLATFAHAHDTPDVVRKAARGALALTGLVPQAAVSLAIHRSDGEGQTELGAALGQLVQTLRRPGIVHVDEPTSGLLATDFEIDRDKDGYFVVCERDPAEVGRNVLGRSIPLVGRKRELAALADAAREAWARPVAQAALIVGPQGSGKSRLRHELVARTRAALPSLSLWIGRGDPISTAVPMSLLAPIVRRLAMVHPGEPAEVSRHKLAMRVAESLSGDEFVRTVAFLGELIGAPFPESHHVALAAARKYPQVLRERVERALVDFARAESKRGPLLCVLEDLHWADEVSLEIVGRLLAELGKARVFVLGTAQPSVRSRAPRLFEGHLAVTLDLVPLNAAECRDLARHVLGGATSPQVEAAITRSSGNPLYLEELLRAIASNRDPATSGAVLAMVESRLGELSADHRRVARAASVFGPVFWRGGVVALLGGEMHAAPASEGIAELVRREICVPCRHSRVAGEDEYAFRHGVLRDAAYEMLTDEDQKLGHRLAGAWLAARGGVSPIVLADHFERGGDRERAIASLAAAAEASLASGDLDGAVRLAERGRGLGATGAPLAALLVSEVEARALRGESGPAVQDLAERALAMLPEGSAMAERMAGRARPHG